MVQKGDSIGLKKAVTDHKQEMESNAYGRSKSMSIKSLKRAASSVMSNRKSIDSKIDKGSPSKLKDHNQSPLIANPDDSWL